MQDVHAEWLRAREPMEFQPLPNHLSPDKPPEETCLALVVYDPKVAAAAQTEQSPGPEKREDPFGYVREFSFLQILPVGSYDKRVPIRCLLCRSAKQPEGKVYECSSIKYKMIKHFTVQHCSSATHLAAVARQFRRSDQDDEDDAKGQPVPVEAGDHDLVVREGISLTKVDKFSALKDVLVHWARVTKAPTQKHSYKFVIATEELIMHHEKCEKLVVRPAEGCRAVCTKCEDPQMCAPSLKSALRFGCKYWGALLLHARLFKGTEAGKGLYKHAPVVACSCSLLSYVFLIPSCRPHAVFGATVMFDLRARDRPQTVWRSKSAIQASSQSRGPCLRR